MAISIFDGMSKSEEVAEYVVQSIFYEECQEFTLEYVLVPYSSESTDTEEAIATSEETETTTSDSDTGSTVVEDSAASDTEETSAEEITAAKETIAEKSYDKKRIY